MICGIGVDVIEIERFERWKLFKKQRLSRIFSPIELEYAFSVSVKTAERLAVRFAAKEAFFKAFSTIASSTVYSFPTVARAVYVGHALNGAPELTVDWQMLDPLPPCVLSLKIHLSVAHSKLSAIACVVLEQNLHNSFDNLV